MGRRSKKKKTVFQSKYFLGIFIVSIMVLSGLGYMMGDSATDSNTYNGQKFVAGQNAWQTEVDGLNLFFRYHPTDVDGISVDNASIQALRDARMVFITFDPDTEIVSDFELARMQFERAFFEADVFPFTGVTANNSAYAAFPVVTCANATTTVPVIVMGQSNETGIDSQGTCIQLNAIDAFDVPILRERLLYSYYGII